MLLLELLYDYMVQENLSDHGLVLLALGADPGVEPGGHWSQLRIWMVP